MRLNVGNIFIKKNGINTNLSVLFEITNFTANNFFKKYLLLNVLINILLMLYKNTQLKWLFYILSLIEIFISPYLIATCIVSNNTAMEFASAQRNIYLPCFAIFMHSTLTSFLIHILEHISSRKCWRLYTLAEVSNGWVAFRNVFKIYEKRKIRKYGEWSKEVNTPNSMV